MSPNILESACFPTISSDLTSPVSDLPAHSPRIFHLISRYTSSYEHFQFTLLWQENWVVHHRLRGGASEWDAVINTNRGTLWAPCIYQIKHQNRKLQKQLMKTKGILLAKLMLSSSPSVSSNWNSPAVKIEQAWNTLFHRAEDLKHRLNFQCVKLPKCQRGMNVSLCTCWRLLVPFLTALTQNK